MGVPVLGDDPIAAAIANGSKAAQFGFLLRL
jgi:hypothetical protein